jgi:hypothetical protein
MTYLYTELAHAKIQEFASRAALELATAEAEARAIIRWNGDMGKNETDRKRNLLLSIQTDAAYINALTAYEDARAATLRIQADMDNYHDSRRMSEWAIRERLTNVLERAYGVVEHDDPINTVVDGEIDMAIDADINIYSGNAQS